MKWKSSALVAVQFLMIAFLLLTGRWIAGPRFVGLEILGALLGAWAVQAVRLRRVHILPDVAPDATLVTTGPYRWIRHPMYTAVLLAMLALVLDRPTPVRALAWLILLADLVMKLRHEERLLEARFPDYAAYRRHTRRLLPFLWLVAMSGLP